MLSAINFGVVEWFLC